MKTENEISILFSGSAGQGLQTLEVLLLRIMKAASYHVFAYSEFMSRIRGGNNSTEIRISSDRVAAFVDRIDLFIPLGEKFMSRYEKRLSVDTLIIGEEKNIDEVYKKGDYHVVYIPLEESAKEIGDKMLINIIIVGLISALMSVDIKTVNSYVENYFYKLTDDKKEINKKSIKKGYDLFIEKLSGRISHPLFSKSIDIKENPLLYGSETIGIGAFAGGCNFVSSYPMSPSTNVLVFMSRNADDFGIVVEQAEDEISAVNMVIGAWYAGARAMVTTSGGGFALMTEGLSLAGAIESPLVIHIGQRPGPATGLPTRTEQADLLMALYSGHGEFPRVILAPGSKEEGISLTCRAFNLADKFQVPVFILTDQFFLDSAYDVPGIDISNLKEEKYFIKTDQAYKRYLFVQNGISPRGIPGWGKGIVCVDSDEHNESGYITEDSVIRTKMVDKRLKKLNSIIDEIIPPKFIGNDNYIFLLVSWGSTYEAVKEAVKVINNSELAYLHFSQVYPLYEKTASFLAKANKTIIIENNATSQFSKIIKSEIGFQFDNAILKYNGMPFTVEELVRKIKEAII